MTTFTFTPKQRYTVPEGPLNIDVQEFYSQRRRGLETGLPQITHMLPPAECPVAIVGSGLSVKTCLRELRELIAAGAQVVAVKRAHEWLIDQGIVPDFAVHCDAQQSTARIFSRPQDATTYLIASHCHPSIWAHLAQHRVAVFHCRVKDDDDEWDPVITRIGGGPTSGERAIALMYMLGARDVHLFGFDSSVREDRAFRVDQENAVTAVDPVEELVTVVVAGEHYTTTQGLYGQIQHIETTLKPLHDIKITAHGRGLFQAVIEEGKRLGWPI
jgi:uncharacterized Rossmann fold enzyme